MITAILSWFATQGVGVILGALAKLALDGFNSYQANQAQREAGAASTASKVNAETIQVQDEVNSVPRPSDDDVAERLRRGTF